MENRKNPRLPDYDYGQNNAYFVTVCSTNREHVFGNIVGAGHPAGPHTDLTDIGHIVNSVILSIPLSYSNVSLDAYTVMPDHVHLLLCIYEPNGPAGCPAPTLPKIVGAFKSICTRKAQRPLWQRGYYEHIIRNREDWENCAKYIANNPAAWAEKYI